MPQAVWLMTSRGGVSQMTSPAGKAAAREAAAAEAGTFLLEEFLPYALSIAANRSSRLFARHYSEAFGLSIAQWRVLAVVGRFGRISPGTVAERTEMDKVKVSRATAALVARGLLDQAADPADGRARLLGLTEAGRAVHQAIIPLARALEGQLAAGLSAAEWESLRHGLRKLAGHVARLEAVTQGAAPEAADP
jgi:DNA-binding MarR family transcriptional regulator